MEEQKELIKQKSPFQIGLAEKIVQIQPLYNGIHDMCRDYIVPNRSLRDVTVSVTQADIAREDEAAKREAEKSGIMSAFTPAYLETVGVYRQIATAMTAFNTIMMHGSVVATEGQGYMITAPSGVGKTTRTKLWAEHIPDSFVVNGDKPLLRVTDSEVIAYGTPWCGKEGWNTNTAVPLRAILLLERSEQGNEISEMSFAEAFPFLLRQTFRPDGAELKRDTLRCLQAMAGKVKAYRFRSEPTAEAVRMAWEAVRADK